MSTMRLFSKIEQYQPIASSALPCWAPQNMRNGVSVRIAPSLHRRCQTEPMQTARWTNPSQPQTLVIAVFLLYINAAFAVLDLLRFGSVMALGLIGLIYFVMRIP